MWRTSDVASYVDAMIWQMYQLWYSEAGDLRPGPRFRLLRDAIRFGLKQKDSRSFAIRTPEGTWHQDSQTSRSIFGPQPVTPKIIVAPPNRPGIVLADIDDEDTQPFGSGSKHHRTRHPRGSGRIEADDEPTDVGWPPLHLDHKN